MIVSRSTRRFLTWSLMRTLLLLALMLAFAPAMPAGAQHILIRLSFKAVLDPMTGQRASGFTDGDIDLAVARMNVLCDSFGRGFRMVRAEPVLNIGGLGDTSGPSRWFGVNFFHPTDGALLKDQMELGARADPAYAWRNDMVNIYVTGGISGGICSFAAEGDNIVIIGGSAAGNGDLQLHELGHYFGLSHTQGSFCSGCGTGPGQCNLPGDDGISDTLKDLACWNQNDIAIENFQKRYADLSPAQRDQVDNVFFNVMSYHQTAVRLTERQLDRWTDLASNERRAVCTGRTWFASEEGCLTPNGNSTCGLFTGPYRWAYEAERRANAAGGDVITLRPGSYEFNTFRRPVTLRATREGPATFNVLLFLTGGSN